MAGMTICPSLLDVAGGFRAALNSFHWMKSKPKTKIIAANKPLRCPFFGFHPGAPFFCFAHRIIASWMEGLAFDQPDNSHKGAF
jgi:hypothetical protein